MAPIPSTRWLADSWATPHITTVPNLTNETAVPDSLRQTITDTLLEGMTKTYLVVYRLSSKAEDSLSGDYDKRYGALIEKLERLEAERLSLFDDEGHASTSCWMVRSNQSAPALGGDLHNPLDKRHDYLAVFEVDDKNQWSMRDRQGRTAPPA